jgi:Ca2+-binding EF-hand superfamily protein
MSAQDNLNKIKETLNDENKLEAFARERFFDTDKDDSNVVDKNELGTALTSIAAMLHFPKPDEQFITTVLNNFDKDNSGKLDFNEFKEFCKFVLINMLNVYSNQN